MKKKIMIIVVVTLLITIMFSGCSEDKKSDNNGTTQDGLSKFIGSWLEQGEAPNNLTWIFYENNSIKLIYYPGVNSYIYWGTFELTGNILGVESNLLSNRFNYEFSNYDTILTLTSIYGGDQTILNKVE